jgi:uncharacterized protein (TIGR04255 family)
MSISFANAPLVEIIAELRWTPTQEVLVPPQQPIAFQISFLMGSKQDEFFMRLGAKLHQNGFPAVERLVPPNFVTLLYQPIYRYKQAVEPSPVLYQAGAGLFSANGIPPYRSWEDFAPFVEKGVSALLDSRDSKEKETQFATVSLRYIDAFRGDLTGGKSGPAFMADVLGIQVVLPDILTHFGKSGKAPQHALQLALPISDDTVLQINLAEGQVYSSTAFILDTTVSCNRGILPEVAELMRVFHLAHDVIHEIFVKLTAPIRELMEPTEEMPK